MAYVQMFVLSVVAGNTMSWINTSVFTLSVHNFPRNRGPVAGIFKAYMGLSAAIYSHFCDVFFSSSPSRYLLMLSTVPPIFCVLTAIFFRQVPPSETAEDERVEQKSIFMFTIVSIALALLLIVKNLVPTFQQGIAQPISTILLCVLLISPALVPLALFITVRRTSSLVHTKEDSYEIVSDIDNGAASHVCLEETKEEDELKAPLLDQGETHASAVNGIQTNATALDSENVSHPVSLSSPRLGDDYPASSLFRTWHAYVLYFTLFCGAGTGMAFANNLGQVSQSFGFNTVTLFTSLFSLGNFFGRITSGNASEYFLRKFSTPRPAWIGLLKLPMIVFFVWLSTGSNASLYAGSLAVGFSHGSHITLAIPVASEFYGVKHFGINYMVLNTHLLLGSAVLSAVIAGYLYDEHATYTSDDGFLTCYGRTCYGITFLVYAGLASAGLLLDMTLSFFSRPLYRHLQKINTEVKRKM
ncbi:hypothetical protein KP509_07G094700 [Ceratopteris richardii]|uniref:Nodulin-like domain-containing protein n=1 Tax=Ceratopteris richardii TaxID=49495 RepID=A0A8T2UNY4_CERRI|nr:hypothetical protein KP509_07G094700 [Ceratopteris richardii]